MKLVTLLISFITSFFAPHHSLGGTMLATSTVQQAEDTYFAATGKYLQVLPGSKLPSYETGDVVSKFGKSVPPGVVVNTYHSLSGDGYWVVYTDNTGTHSIGVGPQASAFTYDVALPATSTATTTP